MQLAFACTPWLPFVLMAVLPAICEELEVDLGKIKVEIPQTFPLAQAADAVPEAFDAHALVFALAGTLAWLWLARLCQSRHRRHRYHLGLLRPPPQAMTHPAMLGLIMDYPLTIQDIVVKLQGDSAIALNNLFDPAVDFTAGVRQAAGVGDVQLVLLAARIRMVRRGNEADRPEPHPWRELRGEDAERRIVRQAHDESRIHHPPQTLADDEPRRHERAQPLGALHHRPGELGEILEAARALGGAVGLEHGGVAAFVEQDASKLGMGKGARHLAPSGDFGDKAAQ